jgi:predicted peroxiredoxin
LRRRQEVSGQFILSLSHAKRATVTLLAANAGAAAGRETIIFLSAEGVRVAQRGYANAIHDSGFAPLKDLIRNFAARGGQILVCSPCFRKLQLDVDGLVPGAAIISDAELIKFRDAGACSCAYDIRRQRPSRNRRGHPHVLDSEASFSGHQSAEEVEFKLSD